MLELPEELADSALQVFRLSGPDCSVIKQVRKSFSSDWINLTDASSSPFFDPHRLTVLCTRIIKLRLIRNIPGMDFQQAALEKTPRKVYSMEQKLIPSLLPAPPVLPHLAAVLPTQQDIEVLSPSPFEARRRFNLCKQRRHWAEKVFENKPNSTTGLKHRRP